MVPVTRNSSSRQILMKRSVSLPQPGAVPMFSDCSHPSLFPLTGGRGIFQNWILDIWGDLCTHSACPHIQRPCGSTSAFFHPASFRVLRCCLNLFGSTTPRQACTLCMLPPVASRLTVGNTWTESVPLRRWLPFCVDQTPSRTTEREEWLLGAHVTRFPLSRPEERNGQPGSRENEPGHGQG